MKRIGITGGLGSGKSYICRLIEEMGYPVLDTDTVAKDIMSTDPTLKKQVIHLFGEQAYFKNGTLNRAHLAEIIFSDKEKRTQLNDHIHPAVYRAVDNWCAKQDSPLLFIESALMIDTGYYKELDNIILVITPIEERMERILKIESHTLEEILARINAQTDDTYKKRFADFVIDNAKGKDVEGQLKDILRVIG